MKFGLKKLETSLYHTVEIYSYHEPFRRDSITSVTDTRTDGRTERPLATARSKTDAR